MAAGMPWRNQLDAQLQLVSGGQPTGGDNISKALEDDNVSLSLPEVMLAASWVTRAIWNARDARGSPKSVRHLRSSKDDSRDLRESKAGTVAIFVEKSARCVLAALGSLLSGTRFVDVPATSRDAEIVRILRVVEPTIVLTTSELRNKLPPALIEEATVVLLDAMPMGLVTADGMKPATLLSLLPRPADEGAELCAATVDDGAFCVLTSGTTSLSKIVVLPHEALTCATGYMADDVCPGDKIGLFWVYYYMLSTIGLGASVFVLPDSCFFNPAALAEAVRSQRLTGLYITPSILHACLQGLPEEQLAHDLASLRIIWLTGEQVTSKLRAKLSRVLPWVRVRNVYSTNESGDNAIADADEPESFTLMESVSFEVLDPQSLAPVPVGSVGALHVRCPWLFKGYWTAEGVGYASGPGERFRTGDLVRCLGGSTLAFVSREAASHIKVRGFKVFPELIEAELVKHPEIEAAWCAAVGDDGDDTSSRLEAAVALTDTSTLSSGTLRSFMAERVPSYMVPVAFRNLAGPGSRSRSRSRSPQPLASASLRVLSAAGGSSVAIALSFSSGRSTAGKEPPTLFLDSAASASAAAASNGTGSRRTADSGKRPGPKELAELLAGLPDLGDASIAALPPNEARLAACWAHVLSIPPSSFSSSSNFFDFGGSLTFFELSKHIASSLGIERKVGTLLQAPTLTAMATLIFETDGAASDDQAAAYDPQEEARKYPITQQLKSAVPLPADAASAVSAATLLRYRALPSKAVLVTGCTGYVGAFVMESLARRDDVSAVVALVRAKDATKATERLRATCAKRAIDEAADFEAWFSKVQALPGDVGETRFGLSEEAYAKLACCTHAMVHAAAEVNMLKPPQALSHTNVGGTSNVLSFAVLAGSPVVFTSTMNPIGGAAPSGYRQSKGAGEVLFREARSSYGVPSAVLQLGDIGIGLSCNPRSLPDDDYIVQLLRMCIAVRKFPRAAWSVSVIAINQCADMLAATVLDARDEALTAVAREVKGDLLEWETLCGWLVPALPFLEGCPYDEWKAEVTRVAGDQSSDAGGSLASAVHEYGQSAIDQAKRMVMLLPAMEEEFAEEDRRRLAGLGAEGELVVDAAWGLRFGTALAAEVAAEGA